MTNGTKQNSLHVYLGHDRKIATLTLPTGTETGMVMVYEPDWQKEGFAVSPHLPLDGNFERNAVRNFLQNMLPEGKGLEEITTNTTLSKNNTFGLIKLIGSETSGALSFASGEEGKKETAFREISDVELTNKLSGLKRTGAAITIWDGKTRLSVAGVQDKLNLLEIDGQLGFGEGALCSNKIFKFETDRAPFIAVNELFTMTLAKNAGLNVPPVEIRSYGEVRTFVIERFDRKVELDNMRVRRRHVIDGCQAVNLPPSYKYERQHGDEGDGIYIRDGVSFAKLFDIAVANPQAYRVQLIRWMTFNILARNYDAHGKNISFFVSHKGLTLAPFYDLVNIEAIIRDIQGRQSANAIEVSNSTQHFAMSIGDHESGGEGNFNPPITAYMLADMAVEIGMSLPRMQLLMTQMIKSVSGAIESAYEKTLAQGPSNNEVKHVELCIKVVEQSIAELSAQVSEITEMEGMV